MQYFVCIGAQRAGTSWLYEALKGHPEVYFPLGKEANVWSIDPNTEEKSNIIYRYCVSRLRGGKHSNKTYKAIGDISPSYATLGDAGIARLYKTFSSVKVFYIVRNPVLRVWSALHLSKSFGQFDVDSLDAQGVLDCFREPSVAAHSLYAENLARWDRIAEKFGGQPLKVLIYEDLEKDPLRFICDVADYIGVDSDPAFFREVALRLAKQKTLASGAPPLGSNVLRSAAEFYREDVRKLSERLGREPAGSLDKIWFEESLFGNPA